MERVRKIGNFLLVIRRIRYLIRHHDLLSSGQLFWGDFFAARAASSPANIACAQKRS